MGRDTIRYVDIGSVDGHRHILIDVAEIPAASAPSRARQLLSAGDTVFSTVRPYLEKIAYIGAPLDGEFASTGFCVLRPRPELYSRYLFYFATSRELLDQVLPLQRGVSYPAVLDKDVRAARIPVPPIAEQRRIVDILEDHLSRLDAADASLGFADRRAALLEAAHLTRAVSSGSDESTLGELALSSGYGTSTRCVLGGPGPAVVRIPNVSNRRIDLTNEKRVADAAVDVSSMMLSTGDLLIVRTNGSRALIGRSAVVSEGIEASFASYLIRYQLDLNRVRPEWVSLMLARPHTRGVLERLAASSAGQYNLSLSKLDGVAVPAPRLDEQDRLILEHSDRAENLQRLRVSGVAARSRSSALRRALLAAAFSGKLTGATSDSERIEELADER